MKSMKAAGGKYSIRQENKPLLQLSAEHAAIRALNFNKVMESLVRFCVGFQRQLIEVQNAGFGWKMHHVVTLIFVNRNIHLG